MRESSESTSAWVVKIDSARRYFFENQAGHDVPPGACCLRLPQVRSIELSFPTSTP